MGCETSNIDPNQTKSQRPNIIDTVKVKQLSKQLLIDAIQEDNLTEVAVIMETQKIKPNSQLSDEGIFWMLHHFCCRWNAAKCLQYILKQMYVQAPRSYIKYVNSQTIEGQTCLHLCAIWDSKQCFEIMNYYGGINFEVKDKLMKDALQTARGYRRKQMQNILSRYKSIGISFTHIEHQKLIAGSMFEDENVSKIQKKLQMPINNKLNNVLGNLVQYTQQEKQIRDKRQKIQKQSDKLQGQRDQIQHQAKAKKLQLLLVQNFAEMNKIEQQKKKKQAEIDKEIKLKSQKLRQTNKDIQNIKQKIVQSNIQAENKKIDDFFNQNEDQIAEGINKRKKNVLLKISQIGYLIQQKKEKLAAPQSNAQDEKKNYLRQSLKKESNGKIPKQLQNRYEKAQQAGIFIDQQFPATQSSIGSNSNAKTKKFTENMVWLRPFEFFKADYELFDGIQPNDIKQGSLGVCYYLATIAVLAKNPQNIKKIFHYYDKNLGFYILRFYINGKQKFIVIDDLIPCSKSLKQPLFTKPIGRQIWVILLEKAWAKLIGTYVDAEAMTPDHMMQDLTGSPSYGEWLTKSPQQKLKQIQSHNDKNHIIVLTSVADKKIPGIVNNHAYSLLGTYEHNGKRIFKIRNPWGRFEWNGKYGEQSSFWTQDLKNKVGFKQADDGIFFLSQQEILEAFCYFSISMNKQNFKYSWVEFTTKGSRQREDIFYTFDILKDCEVNVRVTQQFKRMVKDLKYEYSPLIFEVGKIQANGEVTFIDEGSNRCYWGAKSCHFTDSIIKKLVKGKYFIRVQMLWKQPEKYHQACLVGYAQQQICFIKIPNEQGIKLLSKLLLGFVKKNGKQLSKSGKIKYSMNWMKSQLILYAQTDETNDITVTWKFDKQKLMNVVLGLNKQSQETIIYIVKQGQPNIGTAAKISIHEGATTGSVQITGY